MKKVITVFEKSLELTDTKYLECMAQLARYEEDRNRKLHYINVESISII